MKKLILPVILFFSLIAKGQNYITDYHQPAILGHQLILQQRYQEAQDYLEPCVKNFDAFAAETYSLALCYAVNSRLEEAIELVYKSSQKGLRDVAIFQDEYFWTSYISEEEYQIMKDSCKAISNTLLGYNDPEMEWKESDKKWLHDQLMSFRKIAYVKHNSGEKKGDSTKTYIGIEYSDSSALMAEAFYQKIISEDYWYLYRAPGSKMTFRIIFWHLPLESQEKMLPVLKEQLIKGHIDPFFYAGTFDLVTSKLNEEKKYVNIFKNDIDPSIKEKAEQECFEIGIGSKDVIYLQRRAYAF